MIFSKPVTTLIRNRTSWRTFVRKPIDTPIKEKIQSLLEPMKKGPMQSELRYQWVFKEGVADRAKIGTYGVIKGTNAFIAGAVRQSPMDMEDYGYMMEKIILHLTDMGLGSCWLGGSLRRADFGIAIGLQDDEVLPAVIPVGYPARKRSLKGKVMRKLAKSDQRLPWETLFFSENFDRILNPQAAGRYAQPLEMVRLAPSASNKQPWRILSNEKGWHFFLKGDKQYQSMFLPVEIQRIDIGIAMCHFELTALEEGLTGQWRWLEPSPPASANLRYRISWIPR